MRIRALMVIGMVALGVLAVGQTDPETRLSEVLRPGLTLSVDKGCGGTYRYGEYLNIKVRLARAGYLTIFHFSADKKVQILFPNQYHRDNRVAGGQDYTIPGQWFPFQLRVSAPAGKELLFAVVTERDQKLVAENFVDFSQVFPVLGEGWSRSATLIHYGLSLLPPDLWWGAAMCVFYVEGEPGVTPPPPLATWRMSGRVVTAAGAGIADVTITFSRVSGSGAVPASVTTDSTGRWSQTGFVAGTTYRATPTKSGCTFTPAYLDRASESSDVNFTGTCPTVAPPPPAGTGWALFVGISDYLVNTFDSEGVRYRVEDLTSPAKDARTMAQALSELFPNQRILTDSAATYDAVRRGFTEWLAQAPADATVLFYFSGHGGQVPDKDGDETLDRMDETLIMTDGKMILDDEIHRWVTGLRAQKVVIISDSCHSGTIHRGAKTFLVTDARFLPPWLLDGFADDFWREGQRSPSKVVALSACRPEENAWEIGALGHGLFTYCLLEGLKGAADKNGDKTITAQELFSHAQACVTRTTAQLPPLADGTKVRQNPELHDGLGAPVPLVRVR